MKCLQHSIKSRAFDGIACLRTGPWHDFDRCNLIGLVRLRVDTNSLMTSMRHTSPMFGSVSVDCREWLISKYVGDNSVWNRILHARIRPADPTRAQRLRENSNS